MEVMHDLSFDEWDYIIPALADNLEADDNLYIVLGPDIFDIRTQNQLKNSLAMLGLYQLLTHMILHQELYKVQGRIILQGLAIGVMRVDAVNEESTLQKSSTAPYTAANGSALSSNLKSESGSVTDGATPESRIAFTYDDSSQIDRQDLFMVFLDGLVTATEADEQSFCQSIAVMSPLSATGQAVIIITPKWNDSLKYAQVKEALFLIWSQIVLGGQRFGDLQFTLYAGGFEIGTGVVSGVPLPGRVQGSPAGVSAL